MIGDGGCVGSNNDTFYTDCELFGLAKLSSYRYLRGYDGVSLSVSIIR